MRARWRSLFLCALASLSGAVWLADSFHSPLATWVNVPLVGMLAVAGIAFAAMMTHTRSRWPAGVALLCAIPMGLRLARSLSFLPEILQSTKAPGALVIFGAISAISVAIYALVVPPPPPPDDRVPRARQL